MKRYFSSVSFTFGFILISIMALLFLLSLFYIPYDTSLIEITNKLKGPSASHLLGTDQFGRDIFSRVLKGIQASFLIALSSVAIGGAIGTLIGALSGYYGGRIDTLLMKLIDVLMAFPGVLLAMMLIAVFGNGLMNTITALSVMLIARFARIIRSGFLKARGQEYVLSEKLRGASSLRIIFIHILPNQLPELVATASISFATSIMAESGLSYLGMGLQPPSPSLGIMLSEAQDYILLAPHYVLIPSFFITLLVVGFNMLGDGIQDVNGRRV